MILLLYIYYIKYIIYVLNILLEGISDLNITCNNTRFEIFCIVIKETLRTYV